MNTHEDIKKKTHSKLLRQTNVLIWKSYLQRQRRWRSLLAETLFAGVMLTTAVFIAKPVFLTPLEAEPLPPMTAAKMLSTLPGNHILGYAPNTEPYVNIMSKVAESLNTNITGAASERELNLNIYKHSQVASIKGPVIWIIWKPMKGNTWDFSIRSTNRALYKTSLNMTAYPNQHIDGGFLAVQLAVSQAIVEYAAEYEPRYEVELVAMPVSPLMQEERVKKAVSGILFCFTLALILPMLESVALVVRETQQRFKRALRMRGVEYTSMYIGWLTFSLLSALPISMLAAVTLILIFRWIHFFFALVLMLVYFTAMIVLAFIMAMFHSTAWVACIWSILFTIMQTYLAELLVHHEIDSESEALTFLLLIAIPPLGLVHAFNKFALLQTGTGHIGTDDESELISLLFALSAWCVLILTYFSILMLLQYTIGHGRAIGGQVSWKSIIFRRAEDVNELRLIENPKGNEREPLQEVDDLVAKAISFRNVSKSIMGVPVLKNITMDIYRGEFTMLFAERIQGRMIITIEDLLTGLTYADKGSINILGHMVKPKNNYMTTPHMIGYCHRSIVPIDDLTVQEHFTLFLNNHFESSNKCKLPLVRNRDQHLGERQEEEFCATDPWSNHYVQLVIPRISLWTESDHYIAMYGDMRMNRLVADCDLKSVLHERAKNLDIYYKAQLCWALAMLLEPRIIIVPNYTDSSSFVSVINDKVMQYKKYITIVTMCMSSIRLEYADRVFLFDSKILTFGGTPAYMFFKHGRDYRIRLKIRSDATLDSEGTAKLMERVTEAGATIRANYGSLLILRMPSNPSDKVANLIIDLMKHSDKYELGAILVSIPDTEEVYKRAIEEARAIQHKPQHSDEVSRNALKRIAEPVVWQKQNKLLHTTLLRYVGWKYFSFYIHYRLLLVITILSALAAGVMFGLSFSFMLTRSGQDDVSKMFLHGDILTVEYANRRTTLVIRSDDSQAATSFANAYVLSEPNASSIYVEKITYTAIQRPESLTEYLVTRAIDSPQMYVYKYAYGVDVLTGSNETLSVRVLYSRLHFDEAAAARSLAKSYTALLRHYTDNFDASIRITDDPLALDLTPWMKYAIQPYLLMQCLLIMSIAHITLIPSNEHGLIRHTQSHASNFSPAHYWLSLYFCDLILYWALVGLKTGALMLTMYLVAPVGHFYYVDLLGIPFVLFFYGIGLIPQAYLFSLGPRVALNLMTFVIVNIVFGESTIITKFFYGDTLNFVTYVMSLSPLFNLAYALVNIKQTFLYNSECIIYKTKQLCSADTLHKCCQKCGILQECFVKKTYLSRIANQMIALAITSCVFMSILILIEYKVIQRIWRQLVAKWMTVKIIDCEPVTDGAANEKRNVLDRVQQIKVKHGIMNTRFGECILAQNLSKREMGTYTMCSIYLGLGKGESIALSGLTRHGRQTMSEILAGYRTTTEGHVWCMSKWNQQVHPHKYASHTSLSCDLHPLPSWMSVYDALELIAMLRGVPKSHVKSELKNYLEALAFSFLELSNIADTLISRISPHDRTRLHFAAAVIGAPQIIVLDECTAHQRISVRRAMYFILTHLMQWGHSVLIFSSNVESHLPVATRMGIILDGQIYDIDTVDNLISRYSSSGYTVVLHLKDEVDVNSMFAKHFTKFVINDTTEVLVNVQVFDDGLTWDVLFQKMEDLKSMNHQVYSYIVTVLPIDYIYNTILQKETGIRPNTSFFSGISSQASTIKCRPSEEILTQLKTFEQKYHITKLKELPWSVIFHNN